MYKPKSLRKALTDAVPVLARNPDMMRVFIDNGNLASTLATSLSFENRYTLNVVVTDFTDDIELLLVPIQAWLRIHQADIGHLIQRRQIAVVINHDVIQQAGMRPASTNLGQIMLEGFHRLLHFSFSGLLDISDHLQSPSNQQKQAERIVSARSKFSRISSVPACLHLPQVRHA